MVAPCFCFRLLNLNLDIILLPIGLNTSLKASKVVFSSSYIKLSDLRVRPASLPNQFTTNPACLLGSDSPSGPLKSTSHSALKWSSSDNLSIASQLNLGLYNYMKKSAIYTTLRNLLIEYFTIYHDNLAIILLSLSTF